MEGNLAQEIDFPAKPFYIQSQIGMANWALTVVGEQIKMSAIQGNVDFLWTARKDVRGGAVLTHIGSGLILTAQVFSIPGFPPAFKIPGGPLLAKPFDASASNQLFRAEVLDGSWRGINSLLHWELKVNVYHSDPNGTVGLYRWDGGAPNEKWLLIEESAQVETVSIEYHKDLAKVDLSLPPKFSGMSVQDNRSGGVALTGSQAIATTVTDTRAVTNATADTTGRKYTQTFGAKGGIDKVFEVSASAGFEESSSTTISFTDQSTHATADTITQTVQYNVPPGKKYGYQLVVYSGKCEVPYTAQMRFQSVLPGSVPVPFTSTGVFTGVNQVRNEVVVSDLTETAAPKMIQHAELPMARESESKTGD